MATQITLKLKDPEGNVQKKQHEIEDIDVKQFEDALKVVTDIIFRVSEDESLKKLFTEMFKQNENEELKEALQNKELSEEERKKILEELEQESDTKFLENLVGAFEVLAAYLPEQAFKLLSVLSGIDLNTLRQQKLFDVLDIYDAVIDENDIERLWKRAKKSFAFTKAKMSFLKLKEKATSQNEPQ